MDFPDPMLCNYNPSTWITDLVEYWVNRCDIKNKKTVYSSQLITSKNAVIPHSFVMTQCIYNNGFRYIFDMYSKHNVFASPRLDWYFAYFKKMDNNYSFIFYLNHLDMFGHPSYLGDIDAICFGCSINSNNNNVIPILDAHHLWDCKAETVYNPLYDLQFDTTPFDTKINKIVWRGALIPTFLKDFKLLHLRKDVCDKWGNNSNFNIGTTKHDSPYTRPFLNLHEFTQYKYILNIDGHGASFDGTVWKLRSTSLVIWITDPNNQMYMLEWFFPLLKPFVHYVPSSIDKLQETFDWCEANPEQCKQIIEASTTLMNNILQNTDTYHRALFDRINEIYNNSI
jgi:hypothetical protein